MDGAVRGFNGAVRSIASEAIRAEGAELVDMEFRREPAGWVLRLFIDKEGGAGLDDCKKVSEAVGTLLEVEDPIPHAYTLEVSSPGLTRPLREVEDWERAVGSLVKVVTHQPVAGRQSMTGRLVAASPESVRVDVEGEEIEFRHDLIARARREIEWPAADRRKRRPGRGSGGSPRKKHKTAHKR
jgi:ribosome maturation factor RimP